MKNSLARLDIRMQRKESVNLKVEKNLPNLNNREKIDLKKVNSASGTYQRRQWHPTPVLLPGKSHGWRSLVGCSPWGREESDTTERLPFHFSLSCTGEGNGNPLQCFCLENSMHRGAWWATVHGITKSWAQLSE